MTADAETTTATILVGENDKPQTGAVWVGASLGKSSALIDEVMQLACQGKTLGTRRRRHCPASFRISSAVSLRPKIQNSSTAPSK
jgi:hypothetical protein